MNENINLCEILKDCPKGTRFYSPLYGDVEFISIIDDDDYPIKVEIVDCSVYKTFTKEGFYYNSYNKTECLLLPSKDQRDWSKWKCPKPKKPKFDPKSLKPFDKIIAKYPKGSWRCAFFSHLHPHGVAFTTESTANVVPFNDETKHLVGTTDEAPDFYKYWED